MPFKDLIETIKNLVIFVFLPVALLAYYIIGLINKIKDLQSQLTQSKQKEELQKFQDKEDEDEKNAQVAESDYDKLRDQYLNTPAPVKPSPVAPSTDDTKPKS